MVNKKLKQIFMYSLLNLFLTGFLSVGAVHAQSWPQSRISFVVGYAPGGSTDIAAPWGCSSQTPKCRTTRSRSKASWNSWSSMTLMAEKVAPLVGR